MKIADFATPATADEARRLLKDLGPRGLPVAGGTSLLFLRGDQPVTAVDLSRCGLSGIAARDGHFEIGATTPISDLQDYRADGWVLHRVADRFVSQQIRHQSTLGGNVARVFPWSDFAVALAALEQLAAAGTIAAGSRVVVVSTASGLKFADFKIGYHEARLAAAPAPRWRNQPVAVAARHGEVRDALWRGLDARA